MRTDLLWTLLSGQEQSSSGIIEDYNERGEAEPLALERGTPHRPAAQVLCENKHMRTATANSGGRTSAAVRGE